GNGNYGVRGLRDCSYGAFGPEKVLGYTNPTSSEKLEFCHRIKPPLRLPIRITNHYECVVGHSDLSHFPIPVRIPVHDTQSRRAGGAVCADEGGGPQETASLLGSPAAFRSGGAGGRICGAGVG